MPLVPLVQKVDPGRANRNAMAEALATQQFFGTIKAEKQAETERGLARTATGGGPGAEEALRGLAGENVGAAQDVQEVLAAMTKAELAETKRRSQFLGKTALGVLSAPLEQRAALYTAGLASAQTEGFEVGSLPPQYSSEVDAQLQSIVGQAMTMEQQVDAADKLASRAHTEEEARKERNFKLTEAEKKRVHEEGLLTEGMKQDIVQLQGARDAAKARGDFKEAAEISRRIRKIGDPATGKTEHDVNAATMPNITRAQNVLDDGDNTIGLINDFREVVKSKNLGAVGDLRMFWQGVRGQVEAVNEWLIDDAVMKGVEGNIAAWFNPDLSTQDWLANQLAYRLALANNPDGRISDPDFKAAKESLGFDRTFTGADDVMARLAAFERQIVRAQDVAHKRLGTEREKEVPEPEITVDTGAMPTDLDVGTETNPNAEGVVMHVVVGEDGQNVWEVK